MSATPTRPDLYSLLPAVYRIRDSALGEPLRALLVIIQRELDAIDEDIAGLYENWFIETCQEWVVPYIGDLLGARGLKPIAGGAFTARPFVAHTLKYRRSKGTAAMLEGLAHDVTNWSARVVEFFELLEITQYLNHQRTASVVTPDLRDTNALELLGGPFERTCRTVEVRPVERAGGKYNAPNLGIYVWRLESFPITQATARPVTDGSDGRYRFNPLGLDVPLFNQPQALAADERVADEVQVKGALRRRALYDDLEALRQALVDKTLPASTYFGAHPVLEIAVAGTPVPPEKIVVCDLSDQPSPPGSWPQPPASEQYTPSAGGPKITLPISVSVDPALGRLFFTTGSIPSNPAQVLVSYSYAFSGNLGGGPYDRGDSMPPFPTDQPLFQVAVTGQIAADNNLIFASLSDAIANPATGWNAQAPGTFGVIAVLDSQTYAGDLSITIPDNSDLLIVAADWPGLRQGQPSEKALEAVGIRPHLLGNLLVTGTAAPNSQNPGGLILNGLLIDGSVTVEPGNLGSLQVAHCTLKPSAGGIHVSGQVQGALATQASSPFAFATPAPAPHPVNGNGSPPPPPPPPTLRITTTSPLPGATVNAPYSTTFAATGGTGLAWSATALPPGLSMSAAGVLSGTPQTAGNFNLNVTVNGDAGASRTGSFALTVNPALAIATGSPLPAATLHSAYSETLAATGGSGVYSWSAVGLPAWLSLSASGVLTGTPPATASASFTITVTESNGATRSGTFALTVLPPALVITATQLAGGAPTVAYSQSLSGTGGQPPLTWSLVAGALPPGLALAAATGAISGAPRTVGSFSFTVQLADSAASAPATRQFTIAIVSGLTITTAAMPAVTVGATYAETLAASGAVPPVTWSVSGGTLPAGLQLDPATGNVAGTPTSAGSFAFTAQITDSASATATKAFTIVVAATPVIAATALAGGTQGAAYSQNPVVAGGTAPFAWSVASGALPPGLTLDSATGRVSGNPTAAGAFSFAAQVKDSSSIAATQQFSLTIAPPLAITAAQALPGGTAEVPYSVSLAATGGTLPLVWSLTSGSLPPGLSLSASGVVAGTPSNAASSQFTVQVKDAAGASATASFSLIITPALAITTTALPTAEINVPYSVAVTAAGGTPPYAFSLAAGTLPAPLTLAPDGSIRGTPTATGAATVTVQCSDHNSVTVRQAFQFTVASTLAISTPPALPTGVAGSSYNVALAVSGGVAPFRWAVSTGALPPGVTLSGQGVITGEPAAPGTFNPTVTVTDAAGVASSRQFTVIVIDDNPSLQVTLIRSICGPLSLDEAAQLTLVDSIVDAAGKAIGIAAPAADASIQTSTVIGAIGSSAASGVRTLAAGNSIFTAPVFVERRQTGCVRFSYVAPGSRTPRRYRSQPDLALKAATPDEAAIQARLTPTFTALTYGQPGYAQLSRSCAAEIRTGAEDGSEMGSFDFLKQPQREDNLRGSLSEFLRFGLEAGIFFVT
jgi:hypothetical protein